MLARIFARSAASSAVPTEVDSAPRVGYITSVTAGWSSPVARWAHNPKVAGSNPAPATNASPRDLERSGGFVLPAHSTETARLSENSPNRVGDDHAPAPWAAMVGIMWY